MKGVCLFLAAQLGRGLAVSREGAAKKSQILKLAGQKNKDLMVCLAGWYSKMLTAKFSLGIFDNKLPRHTSHCRWFANLP